jgi:protein-tyrosine phosphatase
VHPTDLEHYDLIVAMDSSNRSALHDMTTSDAQRGKLRLLREFDPDSDADLDVPDPYYGGPDGFADVFHLVDSSCRGLLDELVTGTG